MTRPCLHPSRRPDRDQRAEPQLCGRPGDAAGGRAGETPGSPLGAASTSESGRPTVRRPEHASVIISTIHQMMRSASGASPACRQNKAIRWDSRVFGMRKVRDAPGCRKYPVIYPRNAVIHSFMCIRAGDAHQPQRRHLRGPAHPHQEGAWCQSEPVHRSDSCQLAIHLCN